MPRKPLPKAVETAILIGSRRRCCICFGLDRDTELKSGQIAHLDRDSSNHSEANLAFLCFHHHDAYDSTSSQRKNYTIGEVKRFKEELYSTINKAFSQAVHFGDIKTPPSDPFAGTYIRLTTADDGVEVANGAEIVLTPLPDSIHGDIQYYVSGFSEWGGWRDFGPNIGAISFVGILKDSLEIVHQRHNHDDSNGETRLSFDRLGNLRVSECGISGQYGMNVTFEGRYKRA